jgi:hypothetical protein
MRARLEGWAHRSWFETALARLLTTRAGRHRMAANRIFDLAEKPERG